MGKVPPKQERVAVRETGSIEPGQGNVTRLPMGPTRPVFKASYSSQNYKNTLTPQFQGLQKLNKISPNNSSTCVHNFKLSDVSNDNHQVKIDHPQQTVSSNTPSQFSCLQSIQDKMIVNTTNSSYQMIPVKTAQAEEKSCDTSNNIRKPYLPKKVPIQRAPQVVSDPAPERKRTAPINPAYTVRKSRVDSSVHMEPYRDSVIHLLALKDYKKSELLIRLQKEGIKKSDRISLRKILFQVANLNTSNLTYTLKDCFFKEVQRDWPGYNDEDKQYLDLVLSKKLGPFQNATEDTNHPESSLGSSTGDTPSQDQLFNLASTESLMKNKVKISHPMTTVRSTSNDQLNNNSEKSRIRLSSSVTTTKHIPPPLPRKIHLPISNPALPMNANRDSCSAPERPGTKDPYVANISHDSNKFQRQPSRHNTLEPLASISIQMKYPKPVEKKYIVSHEFEYKFTGHTTKSPSYSIVIKEKQKTDSKTQDEGAKPSSSKEVKNDCASSCKTSSTSEDPDYLTDYVTIVSSEQRQQYEKVFKEDYSEYQALYGKILILSQAFSELESQRNLFSPGSEEYHDISKKVSLEYQKMRQMNPNFCAEKQRSMYLYNKLVHIKKLMSDFDQQVKPNE